MIYKISNSGDTEQTAQAHPLAVTPALELSYAARARAEKPIY